jgi:hypothetical protein
MIEDFQKQIFNEKGAVETETDVVKVTKVSTVNRRFSLIRKSDLFCIFVICRVLSANGITCPFRKLIGRLNVNWYLNVTDLFFSKN